VGWREKTILDLFVHGRKTMSGVPDQVQRERGTADAAFFGLFPGGIFVPRTGGRGPCFEGPLIFPTEGPMGNTVFFPVIFNEGRKRAEFGGHRTSFFNIFG